MNKGDEILVTYEYGQDPIHVLGVLRPTTKGVNPLADKVWESFKANPSGFRFEPSYIEHKDGSVELLEVSLVINQKAPSMALGDLIADLD